MSQDSIYGEDFYEESDHFHYMPYDIVVPTMDWIAERFYREREEFESKMAKLEQLIRMAKAMIGDLEVNEYSSSFSLSSYSLQTTYPHPLFHASLSFNQHHRPTTRPVRPPIPCSAATTPAPTAPASSTAFLP